MTANPTCIRCGYSACAPVDVADYLAQTLADAESHDTGDRAYDAAFRLGYIREAVRVSVLRLRGYCELCAMTLRSEGEPSDLPSDGVPQEVTSG